MIHYSDLSLRSKITIVMESMMILLCIILCVATILFFSRIYEKETDKLAKQWTNVIAVNIDQTWNDIYSKVIKTTTGNNFLNIVIDDSLSQIDKKIDLQSDIMSILSSSVIIDNVYFVSGKNEVLCSFDDFVMNPSILLSSEELADIKGVTVLPESRSPFKRNGTVVPVVVPFNTVNDSNYIGINQSGNSRMYLVILLSTSRMKDSFKEILSSELNISIQLYFDGEPILVDLNQYDDSDYISRKAQCNINGLEVDIKFDKGLLFSEKRAVIAFSVISMAVIVLISGILISIISKRLMAPFSTITKMLDRMKHNTYKFDVQPKYRDESGALIESINDMYKELMDNLDRIKYEEKQKFQYMSQMLTEQINPHFIYNTLEIINMEIINGNLTTASEMVSSFSMFLRYSLNQGSYMISLGDEIRQAENYMKIMNFRLNGIISLSVTCDEDLYSVQIPKLILQPLIENAIKHGFGSFANDEFIDPRINVEVSCSGNILNMTVSDNGQGIDIEKARRAMTAEGGEKSFGLSNIYTRLQLFDHRCDVSFSSIPYFKNDVTLSIYIEELDKYKGFTSNK